MNTREKQTRSKRQYPAFWEKFVPIALGFIVVVIVVLLLIIVAVAVGLFPGV